MRNTMRYLGLMALSALLLSQAAAVITFNFNTVHTGGTPGGPAPWAVMTITDIAGGVTISLTNSATNPAGQFIGYLNMKFNTLPTGFNFTGDPYVTSISLGSFSDAGLVQCAGELQDCTTTNSPAPGRDFHLQAIWGLRGGLCGAERQRDGAHPEYPGWWLLQGHRPRAGSPDCDRQRAGEPARVASSAPVASAQPKVNPVISWAGSATPGTVLQALCAPSPSTPVSFAQRTACVCSNAAFCESASSAATNAATAAAICANNASK